MLPEFKKRIDTLRDILVGAVPSPAGQIEQITYALIYKFMSDIDDRAASLPGGKRTYFTGEYEKYGWHELMAPTLGAHDRLTLYREALGSLAKNPGLPELFQGIYQNAYLTFNDPRVLTLFLKEIDNFKHSGSDDIGDAYEYLLQITGAQGDVGQFRTPRHIIKFIVEAVNPTKNDSVLDPAVGTAGFLIAAYSHVKHHHDGVDDITGLPNDAEERLTADELDKLHHNYHGFDIDPTMVRTAKVNMYLHGFKTPDIKNHDSLSSEDFWNERYDVILANPPFMSPKGGIKPHDKFGIAANRAEVLFVDYIASHLKPNGRAGVIVPDGVLTRTDSRSYAELRKQLATNGLWAVIDLPRGIFQPYSKVKTSILLLDKSFKNDKVIFLNLEPNQLQANVEIDQNTALNLDEVLRTLKGYRKENKLIEATTVNKDEIVSSKDAVLAVSYYQSENDIRVGYVELGDILEKKSRKVGIDYANVPIMSITMRNGLVDQNEKFKKRIATIDISNYKLVLRNELVVGFPIDEGVLGFQTKYDSAAVSPAYDVWSLKVDTIPIEYLEEVLRSRQAIAIYKKNIKGTANRRRVVPKDQFLKIKIPLPDKESPIYQNLKVILQSRLELKKQLLLTHTALDSLIDEVWDDD